ncbi:MAG: PHP domain-containing protein [Candidatus Omnitrophota bacterium]|jgi:predicted metal-dependent phosphoesterase TrpH|nr:MAG: PHP domain-containing protein [Candidatus Omnitrophota bacterium]
MYTVDFHIHSRYSFDALSSIDGLLCKAKKCGLDAIAITDHNTIRGSVEAARRNTDPGFLVICASEVATEFGDMIGLFLNKEITSRKCADVIEEIKGQGGVVLIPHPDLRRLPLSILKSADLIELYSARSPAKEELRIAQIAEECSLIPVGGSDAHFVSDVGSCLNTYEEKIANMESLKAVVTRSAPDVKILKKASFLKFCASQLIKHIKS